MQLYLHGGLAMLRYETDDVLLEQSVMPGETWTQLGFLTPSVVRRRAFVENTADNTDNSLTRDHGLIPVQSLCRLGPSGVVCDSC